MASKSLPRKLDECRPIEQRILRYLDQHGATYRGKLVPDLCSPDSKIGRGIENGSNAFIPAIAANWMRRLVSAEMVLESRNREGYHDNYYVTAAGRRFVREGER